MMHFHAFCACTQHAVRKDTAGIFHSAVTGHRIDRCIALGSQQVEVYLWRDNHATAEWSNGEIDQYETLAAALQDVQDRTTKENSCHKT